MDSEIGTKKKKRIKHGFSIGIDSQIKVTVFFSYVEKRMIICYIIKDKKKFKGIAKLDPRDTYDRDLGEYLALQRASSKLYNYELKLLDKTYDKYHKTYDNLFLRLKYKLTKIQTKNKDIIAPVP